MRKAAAALLAVLALWAVPADAGAVSSVVSLYLERQEDALELIASRTVDWEVREGWHLTLSADVIYRHAGPRAWHQLATGLDVSGTRYFGGASVTLGSRIRTDQASRWYVLMSVRH